MTADQGGGSEGTPGSPVAHAIPIEDDDAASPVPPGASEDSKDEWVKLDFYGHEVVLRPSEKVEREQAYSSTLDSYDDSRKAWATHRERIRDILSAVVNKDVNPVPKKDWKFIKALCRAGIPFSERPKTWVILSGALEEKTKAAETYASLKESVGAKLDEKTARQIEGDINRTFPGHPIFQREEGTECLKCVLSAFALKHPDMGYAQGLNFVAGMLIVVCGCKAEEDLFWMLSSIVKRRMYPDMYGEDLKGCHIAQKILDRLVQKKFPRVSRHFKTLGCELSLVTSEWLLCLFSRSYPMETVAKIWDSLLFEGFKIFYRVSLGFIRLHEAKILKQTNLGDLVMFMKDEVKSSVNNEQIMRRAFHGIGGMRSKQIIKYAIMYEEEVDAMLEHYGNAKKSREGEEGGRSRQRHQSE